MLKPKQKLNARNNKKYKIEVICDSKIYTKDAIGQLPGLYYLVFFKNYPEFENT